MFVLNVNFRAMPATVDLTLRVADGVGTGAAFDELIVPISIGIHDGEMDNPGRQLEASALVVSAAQGVLKAAPPAGSLPHAACR
jgi:hypothetical protein